MNGACLPTYSCTGADNEALEKKMRNVQEIVNMFFSFFFFKKPRLRGNMHFLAKVARELAPKDTLENILATRVVL